MSNNIFKSIRLVINDPYITLLKFVHTIQERLDSEGDSMPGIVGFIQVVSIGSSGVFHIGDVYKIMPMSAVKTFAGSGSFNTGEKLSINNKQSYVQMYDSDGVDLPIAFNV